MKNKDRKNRLEEIMNWYQEDYETNNENPWTAAYLKHEERLDTLIAELGEEIHEAFFASHYAGFIEGMNYAFDIMDITGNGENKELLENLIRNMERGTDDE